MLCRVYREVPYSNMNWNRGESIYSYPYPFQTPQYKYIYTESISTGTGTCTTGLPVLPVLPVLPYRYGTVLCYLLLIVQHLGTYTWYLYTVPRIQVHVQLVHVRTCTRTSTMRISPYWYSVHVYACTDHAVLEYSAVLGN